MKFSTKYVFLALMLGVMPSAVFADAIIVGAPAVSSNAFPFGFSGYRGEYQEIFSGSLFSGPVDITGIDFFGPGTISGNYTLSFSTTNVGVQDVSTNYASNIGADNTVFFSGPVSHILSFSGTPFQFDPAEGNLLLDVLVTTPNSSNNFLASGCSSDFNRVVNGSASSNPVTGTDACDAGINYALIAQIDFTARAVPEPASLALLGAGLLMFAGLRRRTALFRGTSDFTRK